MGTILDYFNEDLPCVAYGAEIRKKEKVDHPEHYGGYNNPYEAIKIIEALQMDFVEGNILKYLLRYKKKNGLEDLEKARWYLERQIEKVKNASIRPE